MSLINEALKRARLEAARQEAAKKGYVLGSAQSTHHSSNRASRPGFKRWWGGLIAIAIVAPAGILTYMANSRSTDRPTSTDFIPVQVLEPSQGSSGDSGLSSEAGMLSTQAAPPLSVDQIALGDLASKQAARLLDAPAAPDTPGIAGDATSAESDSLPAPVSPVEEQRRGAAADRADPGREDLDIDQVVPAPIPKEQSGVAESYAREFELEDGTRVELGGIAWSESGPYALVNGRVVGVGEFVGDLVVASIQPTHIELKGRNRQVLLELR